MTIVHLNALDQLVRCLSRTADTDSAGKPAMFPLGAGLSAICGNNVRTTGKEGFEAISNTLAQGSPSLQIPLSCFTQHVMHFLLVSSSGWLGSYIN